MVAPTLNDDDFEFTAKHAREVADVTYRQLNDWDAKGAVGSEQHKKGSWRKFTARELFALLVCAEIRRNFGVPIKSLRYIKSFMLTEPANHFAWAEETIAKYEWTVYLVTDLKETFIMGSDYEIAGLMDEAYFRADNPQAYIFLHINPLVNKVRRAAGLEPLRTSFLFYKQVREAEAKYLMHQYGGKKVREREQELLRLVRKKENQDLSVHVRNGHITRVDVEEEKKTDSGQPFSRGEILAALEGEDFATVTVRKREGKIVSMNRRTPVKLSGIQEEPDPQENQFQPVIKVYGRGEHPSSGPDSATGRKESEHAPPEGMPPDSGS